MHHKQFGCSECDQTFKSKAELEKHEETDDNATKFSCKCGKLCDSSEDLKKHEETRKNKKTFSYTDCDKKFTAVDELKKHERVHAKLEICPEYAVGRCQFGASGKVGGTCPLSHPRKCIFQFTPRGCKKKESCSFYHQEKRPGSHADDKFVNRDSRPDGKTSIKFQYRSVFFRPTFGQDVWTVVTGKNGSGQEQQQRTVAKEVVIQFKCQACY